MVPSEKRFLVLFTFLKKNRNKKVMVFFSSCNSVKYHYELLNYIDLPVAHIHVSTLSFWVIQRPSQTHTASLCNIIATLWKMFTMSGLWDKEKIAVSNGIRTPPPRCQWSAASNHWATERLHRLFTRFICGSARQLYSVCFTCFAILLAHPTPWNTLKAGEQTHSSFAVQCVLHWKVFFLGGGHF